MEDDRIENQEQVNSITLEYFQVSTRTKRRHQSAAKTKISCELRFRSKSASSSDSSPSFSNQYRVIENHSDSR